VRFAIALPLALCALGGLAAIVLMIDDSGAEPEPLPEWDAEQREVLAGVDFPVFAPEGLRVQLSGWGGGDGRPVTSVSLLHEVEVPDLQMIDVESQFDADTPEDDYAAEAADRLEDAGAEVVSETKWLRVDGAKRRFSFASAGDEWIAIARVGDVTITVHARGIDVDEVRLRALAEPARGLRGVPEYRPHRPDLDVLDPRRVEELADGTPLADLGAPLAGVALPALALLASEDAEPNWFGGKPHLPADARWPEGEYGAMMFVAQLPRRPRPLGLDGAGVRAPARLLRRRAGVRHIEGPGACTILRSEAGAELRERDFPSDLHEYKRLPRFMVKPQPGLSLPDAAVPLMRRLGLDFNADSEYEELWTLKRRLESEQGWHHSYGQLLGWPAVAGEDLMAFFASLGGGQAEDWTLLLHTNALDADLYVALPTADLAAGRFDRAEATIEFD
jgi:hypothetical protein